MQLLYSSTSLAFTQHLRVSLDQADIEYYCSDADSAVAGIGGPLSGSQSRIYILHEKDWDRAVALLREILPSPKESARTVSAKAMPSWLVTTIVVVVVLLVGAAVAQ